MTCREGGLRVRSLSPWYLSTVITGCTELSQVLCYQHDVLSDLDYHRRHGTLFPHQSIVMVASSEQSQGRHQPKYMTPENISTE